MQVIDCRKAGSEGGARSREPANQHSKILQPKVGPKGAAAGGAARHLSKKKIRRIILVKKRWGVSCTLSVILMGRPDAFSLFDRSEAENDFGRQFCKEEA